MEAVDHARQEPRTASKSQSIWKNLDEESFRRHVVDLGKKTQNTPKTYERFSEPEWTHFTGRLEDADRSIPLALERRLADDFAFIVAAEEGTKSVSGVCIEESITPPILVLRVALNDIVSPHVRVSLQTICQGLKAVAKGDATVQRGRAELLASILGLHRNRIHGRLKSKRWKKPSYLQRQPLRSLSTDLRAIYATLGPVKSHDAATHFTTRLNNLCHMYLEADEIESNSDAEVLLLERLVKTSLDFTTDDGAKTFEKVIADAGFSSRGLYEHKNFKQIEKLGAYYRICQELPKTAKIKKHLFAGLAIEYLKPYDSVYSGISLQGQRVACHVHAEIQLVVYYDALGTTNIGRPRVIGCNKAACFLCCLFLGYHRRFFVSQTHGRLYDQWTIPDLKHFGKQQVKTYRRVIAEMAREIILLSKGGTKGRNFPLESRQHVDRLSILSANTSSLATITAPKPLGSESVLRLPLTTRGHGANDLASHEKISDSCFLSHQPYTELLDGNLSETKSEGTTSTTIHKSHITQGQPLVAGCAGGDIQTKIRDGNDLIEGRRSLSGAQWREGSLRNTESEASKTLIPKNASISPNESEIKAASKLILSGHCSSSSLISINSKRPNYQKLRGMDGVGLNLTIEIESPSSGVCKVTKPSKSSRKVLQGGNVKESLPSIIDVESMQYGHDLILEKANNRDDMEISIKVGPDSMWTVRLRWD